MDPNAKKVGSVFSFRPASYWSRGQDLNLRPPGYEPGELPDCSTPHHYVAPTSPARSAFKQEKRQERILPVCLNERKSFLSDSQGLHVSMQLSEQEPRRTNDSGPARLRGPAWQNRVSARTLVFLGHRLADGGVRDQDQRRHGGGGLKRRDRNLRRVGDATIMSPYSPVIQSRPWPSGSSLTFSTATSPR